MKILLYLIMTLQTPNLAQAQFQIQSDANLSTEFSNTFDSILYSPSMKSLEASHRLAELFKKANASTLAKQMSLCLTLNKLNTKTLALAEPHIYEAGHLPCRPQLIGKLKKFQSQAHSAFEQMVLDRNQAGVNQPNNFTNRIIEAVGLPVANFFSGIVPVDTENGEVVYRTDIHGHFSNLGLQKGEIIISFDDGPHAYRTQDILDIVNRYGIKVNFFALGEQASRYPQIVKQAALDGHILGSHSESHPQLTDLSDKKAKKQISEGHQHVIENADTEDSSFFRFPYGSRNTSLKKYLYNQKMSSFFWNMDTLDWKLTDPTELYEQVVSEINREKKGVILFHDIHNQTVVIMDQLLNDLQQAGYTIKLAYPKKWMTKQ